MSVLVTGGAGFVGLNLVEAHLRQGESVTALDRNPLPAAAQRCFATLPGRLTMVEAEVADGAALARIFAAGEIDRVFCGAAITSGPAREKAQPDSVIQVNLLGLVTVIKAARAAGVRRMINLSSASAYGDGGFGDTGWTGPLDEARTREAPATLYAISKYASERICRRLTGLGGIDIVNVRLSSVYGPWEADTGARDTLSPLMQAAVLARDGETAILPRREARDWTYSRDIAAALMALMAAPAPRFDLYNISAAALSSTFDWCGHLRGSVPDFQYRLAAAGEAANIDLHGDRDRLPLSPARLRDDIGHAVPADMAAAHADFAEWLAANPDYWPA